MPRATTSVIALIAIAEIPVGLCHILYTYWQVSQRKKTSLDAVLSSEVALCSLCSWLIPPSTKFPQEVVKLQIHRKQIRCIFMRTSVRSPVERALSQWVVVFFCGTIEQQAVGKEQAKA